MLRIGSIGPMRIPRALCWILVCLGVGCGLSDYESRMDEQRERLRAFDEQSRYLGPALELPGAADKDSPPPVPFAISLQMPKGISGTVAASDGVFLIEKLHVARYPGAEGYNVFVAGVYAAAPDDKDEQRTGWTPAELQDSFRS